MMSIEVFFGGRNKPPPAPRPHPHPHPTHSAHAAQASHLREQHESKNAQLKAQHAQAARQRRAEHAKENQAHRSADALERKNLAAKHAEQTKNAATVEEKKKLLAIHARERKELNEKHKATAQEKREQQKKETAAQLEAHKVEKENQLAEHKREAEAQEKEHKEKDDEALRAHDAKVHAEEKAASSKMQAEEKTAQQKRRVEEAAAQRKQHAQEAASQRARHKEEAAAQRARHEDEAAAQREEHAALLDSDQAKHAATVAAVAPASTPSPAPMESPQHGASDEVPELAVKAAKHHAELSASDEEKVAQVAKQDAMTLKPPHALTPLESSEKEHCALRSQQLAANIAASGVVLAAFVGITLATAGSSLIVQALTGATPATLNMVAPNATKNAYYLGYLHERATCVAEDGKETGRTLRGFGPTKRGKVAEDGQDGCFVWSLLSYHNVNSVRITVFGGGGVRMDSQGRPAVYEAFGGVITGLKIVDAALLADLGAAAKVKLGQLVFFILTGNTEFYVPVHHMDQVQYVSCGDHPLQSKVHVTVSGGSPARIAYKHAHESGVDKAIKRLGLQSTVVVKDGVVEDIEGHSGTGSMGVSMPEKGPIIKVAEACGVRSDGSSGPQTTSEQEPASIRKLLTTVSRSIDFARLNPFLNRKRIEQLPGAVPYAGGP